jgi:hypothetical protein
MRYVNGRACSHGQALTEFLALSLVLVPLFLLAPVLGKYQDISHTTLLASRYAAFDAVVRNDGSTGYKPTSQLADEVRRRVLGAADAPIKTGDVAGDFRAHQNLLWRTPNDKPLIEKFADHVRLTRDAPVRSVDAAPFEPTRELLGLAATGIHTANVALQLAKLTDVGGFFQPFDKLDLAMTRSTSVVVDYWSARGPADGKGEVEMRIGANPALFPVGPLAEVGVLATAATLSIDAPIALPAPRLGQLALWRDLVPEDRLK